MPRVLAYYATRDLIPLYGIYALLFRDHGVSTAQVSSLFVIWSVASFVFEVPSGAWADTVDRRRLLVLSGGVYALGFACWVGRPTYAGFALGFVLWGLSGAIMSGTFEALLYDELAARSATEAYPRIVGWAHASSMVANLVATVSCWPLFAWGGYPLVGWTSVGVALAHTGLAWSLPAAPQVSAADPSEGAIDVEGGGGELGQGADAELGGTFLQRYLTMLGFGVEEAMHHATARRVVLISALLLGLTTYDEYFPLVAREDGATTAQVPLVVAVVVVGQFVGTALAGRTAAMGRRTMGGVVALAAVLISLGAVSGSLAGFVAIAAGYGLMHNAIVVSEARLQEVITGSARATVTSVAGLSSELVALAVYATFAGGARWLTVASLVALLGVATLAVAVAVARWLPGGGVSTVPPEDA